MCLKEASYDLYEHTIYLAKMAMKYTQNILEKYDDVKDEVWLTEQQYLDATNRMMKIYSVLGLFRCEVLEILFPNL